MTRHWRSPLVAAAVLLALAGCSGQPTTGPTDPAPATSSTATPAPTLYALAEKMCDAIDLTALTDLYPTEEPEDEHLINSERECDTALIAGPGRVLGLAIIGSVTGDSALAADPTIPRTVYEWDRKYASGTPTDIDGVGSAAFWHGDTNQLSLVTYDGNLNLTVSAFVVNATHALPADMPERLAAVANATMARLAA